MTFSCGRHNKIQLYCLCEVCIQYFTVVRRRKYCGAACKQKAYRGRPGLVLGKADLSKGEAGLER